MLYAIEWTHDDGMDQHVEFAELTEAQSYEIRNLLSENGGLNVEVYQPSPLTHDELRQQIKEDLVIEEDGV